MLSSAKNWYKMALPCFSFLSICVTAQVLRMPMYISNEWSRCCPSWEKLESCASLTSNLEIWRFSNVKKKPRLTNLCSNWNYFRNPKLLQTQKLLLKIRSNFYLQFSSYFADIQLIAYIGLYFDCKDTKFESNSQQILQEQYRVFYCISTAKILNLKAIHNMLVDVLYSHRIVFRLQRY